MDKEALIDRYLRGRLSGADKDMFDRLMEEEDSFREELQFRENLAAVAFKSEEEALKLRLEKVEKKYGNGKWPLRRILLIILGLILIAAAVIGYQFDKMKRSSPGIYASYYEVYPNTYHPVTRGSADEMTTAFMAYEKGNYSEAVTLLNGLLQNGEDVALRFYLALSYGEQGDYALAIKNLEQVRQEDSAYKTEALWYLGLFYLQQENRQAARERFENYYEGSEDEDRRAQAFEIIEMLGG